MNNKKNNKNSPDSNKDENKKDKNIKKNKENLTNESLSTNLQKKKKKKKQTKKEIEANKTNNKTNKIKSDNSNNIDEFLSDSLLNLENIKNSKDQKIKETTKIKSEFLQENNTISEIEKIFKKKNIISYVSDFAYSWKNKFLKVLNIKKKNDFSKGNLEIKIEKKNKEQKKTSKTKALDLNKNVNKETLSLNKIKNHPLLSGLYNSSIYKNSEEKKRPPEHYIKSIVQLTSFHSERELLTKYYIAIENFSKEDFIKYTTDFTSVEQLINLRDQEQLLLPAPTAAQIVEKKLRVSLVPDESLEDLYKKIEKERKRIIHNEDEDHDFLGDPNFDPNESSKNLDDSKNWFPLDFSEFFASLEKKSETSEDTPPLEKYGTNLTDLAKGGLLDPCFGRDKELSLLMEILVRRQKNNAILIGEAGVGKTAIIELLASKLIADDVPFVLMGREIISLDLTRMVGGARYRGDFEERIQEVVDAVFERPNVIIFIDEIHNITGAGSAEGSMDAANILKPILSRSGFQCVGATTIKEYQRIEKDAALNRRFQGIKVEEPSIEDTINILYGLRPTLEMYHNIEISAGAFHTAADLSSRYITDRFLPDKALDLVDRAAARLVLRLTSKEYSSIISALINSILRKIGKLKTEAFRRGDIATEFIFQEVENAYRNLLLKWVENYKTIAITRNEIQDKEMESRALNSPISADMYSLMQKTILGRVDQLLFTSRNPKIVFEKELKRENLSREHNLKIYKQIFKNNKFKLSLYRCSLIIFIEWVFGSNISNKQNKTLNSTIFNSDQNKFDELVGSYASIGGLTHLQLLREILLEENINISLSNNFYKNIPDFFKSDAEEYSKEFYDLNELEDHRIRIFENFLKKLQPVVKEGLIESNVLSGDLNISDEDIGRIYKLLGYFSTSNGKSFLQSFNEPELLKEARKYGNFNSLKNRIGEEEIQILLCELTGIPIEALTEKDADKLTTLEKNLRERVVGQEEAISAITKAVRRSRLGIQNPNRPIASFLFCGPTGVGKTEVTKALATCLFGSEKDMIRLDMSEFMEKIALSRLVGSPPGYVGYDDGGQLTDAVRRKPYSVVLFDELEKAHPDILNILLQILEDGRLTDSQKRLVGFENTVIIMTSNAAASEIQLLLNDFEILGLKKDIEDKKTNENNDITSFQYKDNYAGTIKFFKSPIKDEYFADIHEELRKEYKNSFLNIKPLNLYDKYLQNLEEKEESIKEKTNLSQEEIQELENNLKNRVLEALSKLFLPEFLNRLDDIIIFQPLKPKDMRQICDILLKSLILRLKDKGFELVIDNSIRGKLARDGYNPKYGARPLRRLITKTIEDLISETILNNSNLSPNSIIRMELDEKDKIICRIFPKDD
jgi:ATP-dependent Clp protease ATP-binding subunit ClpA